MMLPAQPLKQGALAGFDGPHTCIAAAARELSCFGAAMEEEEYCLIPMGGVLPRIPQRVLGIGGTAGMVHPSTGACCLEVPH